MVPNTNVFAKCFDQITVNGCSAAAFPKGVDRRHGERVNHKRYPTSPSEGSLLYDCLKEGLQAKEKLEHFELEAAITGTCKRPFWVIRHSIESSWRDLYKFRGSWGEEGKEHGYCVSNLFQSCSVLVSLHSFYRLASIYISGCLGVFVSTLNQNG